jgi:uncharacterized protein YbjT (DUF2867 family)
MPLKVILTGATGMVGKAALLECLDSPDVDKVLAVHRQPLGLSHPKLEEVLLGDFSDLAPLEGKLAGYQACFFCLGVSSAGMSEEKYSRLTYDLTLGFAKAAARLNPGMTFVYVSGKGTDSTEKGGAMWARVKGRTENALLAMASRGEFKAAFMFRPGFIRPMRGVRTRTPLYAFFIALGRPLFPLLMRFPSVATSSDRVGKAMIRIAKEGFPRPHVEPADINRMGSSPG